MKLSTTTALRTAVAHGAAGVDIRLLEQLFDHTPDTAFFIKDSAGCYIAVNNSLVERHGLRGKSDILGRRPCDVCPGDFGRIPAEQDAHVLRTGRPIIERFELQWYVPNKPVWCLTTKLPIRDASGAVSGIIGISKDVRSPVAPQEIPVGVAAALTRLEAAYAEPLTPADLARIAKLSPARFARIISASSTSHPSSSSRKHASPPPPGSCGRQTVPSRRSPTNAASTTTAPSPAPSAP